MRSTGGVAIDMLLSVMMHEDHEGVLGPNDNQTEVSVLLYHPKFDEFLPAKRG